MNKLMRSVCVAACLAGLAACGGGGGGSGGDGGTSNPPPGPELATVSLDNAQVLASAAVNAAIVSGNLGSLASGSAGSEPQPGVQSKVQRGDPWRTLITKLAGATFRYNVPFGPATEDCLVSGFVTLSGDIANPLAFTPGDRISATFDACDDGEGMALSGQMDMRVESFSGSLDTGHMRLVLTLTLTDLLTDDGIDPVTANGSFRLELDTLGFPVLTDVVSGTRLRMTTATRQLVQEDFSTTTVVDVANLAYTINAIGKVSSSQFSGYVRYSTPTMFTGSGDAYPFEGSLVVEGAGGASVSVTALDAGEVLLEVDINGDGAMDDSRQISWDELIG